MSLPAISENLESWSRVKLDEPIGRAWSPELAIVLARMGENGLMERVFEDLLEGVGFKQVAEGMNVRQGELARWIMADEVREKEYESLLRIRADLMMHETLGIADATDPDWVGVAKLRIDQRNKLGSKWFKARYGDDSKISVNVGGGSLVSILAGLPVGVRPEIEPEPAKRGRVIEAEKVSDAEPVIAEQPLPAPEQTVKSAPASSGYVI